MNVCMYVYACMYVCTYVRTYVCMYVCMHVTMCVCLYSERVYVLVCNVLQCKAM